MTRKSKLALLAPASAATLAVPALAIGAPWDWNAYDWYGRTAQGKAIELYPQPHRAIPAPKRIVVVSGLTASCANGRKLTVKMPSERGEAEGAEPAGGWRSPVAAYHRGGSFSVVRHAGGATDRLNGRFVNTREAVGSFSHDHFKWQGTRCSTGTVHFRILAHGYAP